MTHPFSYRSSSRPTDHLPERTQSALSAPSDVRVVRTGSHVTLTLTGEIDVEAAGHLTAASDEVLGGAPAELVVDLSAATFLDSAGVGALVALKNAATDAGVPSVRLRSGPPNVMRVLEMVGLDGLFDHVD
jgi:anti-sigma B factor antagonist